jgi:hypothetical protein
MVVDLPAPLGPTKPVTCPGVTVNVIASSASVAPNRLRSPATSMVAWLMRLPFSVVNTASKVVVRRGRYRHGASS